MNKRPHIFILSWALEMRKLALAGHFCEAVHKILPIFLTLLLHGQYFKYASLWSTAHQELFLPVCSILQPAVFLPGGSRVLSPF